MIAAAKRHPALSATYHYPEMMELIGGGRRQFSTREARKKTDLAAQRSGESVACYREYQTRRRTGGRQETIGWYLVNIHMDNVEKFTSLFHFWSRRVTQCAGGIRYS